MREISQPVSLESTGGGPVGQSAMRSISEVPEHALHMTLTHGLLWTVLVGLAVWGILESTLPMFELPAELQNLSGNVAPEESLKLRQAIPRIAAKNAMYSLAILGFSLGLVLTVVEHLLLRRPILAACGGLVAGLVAAAVAVAAGAAGAAVVERVQLPDHRLMKTMVVQVAMLSTLGLGIGLAMTLTLFRRSIWKTCLSGGLLGGLLGAFLFPIVAGLLLPKMNTELLVPDAGVGRLLWIGLPACLIGLTVSGLGKEKKRRVTGVAAP